MTILQKAIYLILLALYLSSVAAAQVQINAYGPTDTKGGFQFQATNYGNTDIVCIPVVAVRVDGTNTWNVYQANRNDQIPRSWGRWVYYTIEPSEVALFYATNIPSGSQTVACNLYLSNGQQWYPLYPGWRVGTWNIK